MVPLDLGLSFCDFIFKVDVKKFISNLLCSPGGLVIFRPDSGLLIDVMNMIVAEGLKYHDFLSLFLLFVKITSCMRLCR